MSKIQEVLTYIDNHQDRLYKSLSDLISINTENFVSYGNEANSAAFIEKMYLDLGLETSIYFPDDIIKGKPGYLANRGTDKRPNVAGLYRGTDGKKRLMLAAHTDTVPIGNEDLWTVPPLGGLIKDGRIYGRGSGDNKFGIVASYFALKAIIACDIALKQDVVLSAYCDEEYGGGNGSIASCIKYPCEVYISLDSGNGEIWVCSIGGQALAAELRAREPQDSAQLVVDGMNYLKEELEHFQTRRFNELGQNRFYKGTDMQRSCMRLTGFNCGQSGCDLFKGRIDFSFYTDKPKSQIKAELVEIERRTQAKLNAMNIDFDGFIEVSRYFDYECADENDPAVLLMQDCITKITGSKAKIAGACLSDYFLYLQYGSRSSFGYGILRDFMLYGGSHQPDEYIECKDLVNCTKAISLFLMQWCGNNNNKDINGGCKK